MNSLFIIVRGLVYSAAFILLWFVLANMAMRYDTGLPWELADWLSPVGLWVGAAGAGIALWSIGTLLTIGRGTPAPFDPPQVFVASGPYRWVRNPMYVGATLAMLGTGFLMQSPSIVALSAGFAFCMLGFVLYHEEPTLEARFGESYLAYKAEVHRWLPRPPRTAQPPPTLRERLQRFVGDPRGGGPEMTVKGVLQRILLLYVTLLIAATIVIQMLGIKRVPSLDAGILAASNVWAFTVFTRRNGRYFTPVEKARVLWGVVAIDLGVQTLLLYSVMVTKQTYGWGAMLSVLALNGVLDAAFVWILIQVFGRIQAKRLAAPNPEPPPASG